MAQTVRDRTAGLKLRGGLARLDALHPAGFSVAQLAEHARVNYETARAFLNETKGPGYAAMIPGAKAVRENGGRRPGYLYRLRDDRRSELMDDLAEMRRQLDLAEGIQPPSTEQLYAPLDLLEKTVEVLERRTDSPDDWKERLSEARLELDGVTADARALSAQRSPEAARFADKLEGVQLRLAAIERAGSPGAEPEKQKPQPQVGGFAFVPAWAAGFGFAPALASHRFAAASASETQGFVDSYRDDLFQRTFDEFNGRWLDKTPSGFEPVLVLLDGIRGRDPVSDALVAKCHAASIHVAVFNLFDMLPTRRAHLYGTLDSLRMATPLAVSNFVLALDGSTNMAPVLANEFSMFGRPGEWRSRAFSVFDPFVSPKVEEMRHSCLMECGSYLSGEKDPIRALYAKRVFSTLDALATANVAVDMPRLPFAKQNEARWRYAARGLMGDIVCVDSAPSAAIEKSFAADGTVGYVACDRGTLPDAWDLSRLTKQDIIGF